MQNQSNQKQQSSSLELDTNSQIVLALQIKAIKNLEAPFPNRSAFMTKFHLNKKTINFHIENLLQFAKKTNDTEILEKMKNVTIMDSGELSKDEQAVLEEVKRFSSSSSEESSVESEKDILTFITDEHNPVMGEIALMSTTDIQEAIKEESKTPQEPTSPVVTQTQTPEPKPQDETPKLSVGVQKPIVSKQGLKPVEEQSEEELSEEDENDKDVFEEEKPQAKSEAVPKEEGEKIPPQVTPEPKPVTTQEQIPPVVTQTQTPEPKPQDETPKPSEEQVDEAKTTQEQKEPEPLATLKPQSPQNDEKKSDDEVPPQAKKPKALKEQPSEKEEQQPKKRSILKIIGIIFLTLFILALLAIGGFIYMKNRSDSVGALSVDTVISVRKAPPSDLFSSKSDTKQEAKLGKDGITYTQEPPVNPSKEEGYEANQDYLQTAQAIRAKQQAELKKQQAELQKRRGNATDGTLVEPESKEVTLETQEVVQEETIDIDRFQELKSLHQIKGDVLVKKDSFMFEEKLYKEGDSFYRFTVDKVTKSFIKFKDENNKKTKVRL